MDSLNVTIYGVGNVGSTIAALLLNTTNTGINLNICDPDLTREGTVLDLSHAAMQNVNHRLTWNDLNAAAEADFVFHCAGNRVKGEHSRLDLSSENHQITKDIFSAIEFKKEPFVIVVSNPVDNVAYYSWKESGFHSGKIIGTGTLLDSIRLNYYISKKLNCLPSEVSSWVLGEHGASQVPIFSRTTFKNQNISEVLSKEELEECALYTVQAAGKIRKTQGATYYGASFSAVNIFNSLNSDVESIVPASVLINDGYKSQLSVDQDLFISLPIVISNEGFSLIDDFEITQGEKDLLKSSAEILLANM